MGYATFVASYNKRHLPEKRRNWIMRVRFGPPWTIRQSENHENDGDLIVKGKTMSTFMRLPQISHRDVTIHKRQFANGKRERISFMAINNLRRSIDDFHLGAAQKVISDDIGDTKMEAVSSQAKSQGCDLDVRMPQTAPNGIQRRRWSDGGATMPLEASIRPYHRQKTYDRPLLHTHNGLSAIKSDSCVVQSADEILQEYKEYAKRMDDLGEGRNIRSSSLKVSELAERSHLSNDHKKNFVNVDLPTAAIDRQVDRPRPHRRNTSKLNLAKHKKRVLVPSGDSSGSRTSSLERFPGTGRTASSSTLLKKKSSRIFTRKPSMQKKSDMAMKNKKIVKPDSPPPGPSEEEMQEIQELPVIRKFLKMPESRPKVVCFDYPGVDLTHMDVKKAIEKVIPDAFASGKVVSIQFENVNVKLATGGLENRWLIELKDFATRNLLIKNGLSPDRPGKNSLTDLKISVSKKAEDPRTSAENEEEEEITFPPINYPKKVQVKLNDTVAMEEYKLYLRRTAAEEKLQNVILLCAGRGDKLLTTML